MFFRSSNSEQDWQTRISLSLIKDRRLWGIIMVLLDMMMPNLHTPYIIQALQRINSAVKVIAMSGTSANESFTKCGLCPIVERYALGAFLTKPFMTTEMLHTLANLELN